MDTLTKAITKDGFMRIYAVTSTDMVNEAQKRHKLMPVASAALGRLLSAGVMMGGMLKGDDTSLTLRISGDGALGVLCAVADSKGNIKGYVSNPTADLPLKANGKLDVGGAVGSGVLSVIKDLKLKEPYCGQVALKTGEIGDDLAYYFMQSEQVPSVVGLGVLVDRDYTVKHAGGFIVQVMPQCDEKSLKRLENSISNIMSVTEMMEQGMDSAEIIKYVMLGFETEIFESTPVQYRCDCSRERTAKAIASLGRREIEDMISEQGGAEVMCHFCNSVYKFTCDDLQSFLK